MKYAKIGDKVAMARTFLNAIQAPADMYDLRGIVIEIKDKPLPRAKVDWKDDLPPTSILLKNLSKISSGETKSIAEGIILE